MTLTLSTTQVRERLTVTLTCVGATSVSAPYIVVDWKAYTGLWTPGTLYTFTYDISLERGPHTIYGQVTDSVVGMQWTPLSFTYVMAYELATYGIDVYSGDAKLDVIEPILHDELLPALPTLNFSCATLLTGTIGAVIRERGLRQYQFTIATVAISNGIYAYTCKAAESYALTTAIMALQTAYGSTADALGVIAPSLNIINASVQVHSMENLVTNGDFETDIVGWEVIMSGGTISRETVFPLDGMGSLKYVQASGAMDFGIGTVVNVIVGHSYIITGLVKSTATAGHKVECLIAGVHASVDCSISAQPVSVSLVASGPTIGITFYLDGITAGDYFLLDSVTCYDLTPITAVNLLAQTTYPQLFSNIQPLNVIEQLMIQALAQASVRNGNLYVFPLDVSDQLPDYHMQRLDPLTGWQRDADIYDAVEAHYIVKQYPTPDTVLTLNDALIAGHWTGTVSNVTQVATTLLPVPSGALGMLKSVGDCHRDALSVLFKDMDRIRFNWLPVTAAYVDISLQQDGANKLDLRHYFAGQSGAGFILNTGTAPTDMLTKDIALSPIQFVTTVTGTTTQGCSYRVTLLDAGDATLWQDAWIHTIGNAFVANVPSSVSQTYQATTVRIEFKDLYLIGTDYGVQAVTCTITGQTYNNVGSHERVVSSTQYYVNVGSHVNVVSSVTYSVAMINLAPGMTQGVQSLPAATSVQWYEVSVNGLYDAVEVYSDRFEVWWHGDDQPPYNVNATAVLKETVQDYEWQTVVATETVQDYEWQPFTLVGDLAFFNLFESVDLVLSDFTRTGTPTTLATIALTFAGDNYVDSLVLVADNPLPVTVRAGTGSRAYTVPDDFGSEAGAQAYAAGLLPIVSVAREQYTRDVSLATDLSVGDTVDADGVNMTVYAIDYRQDGKTIAAGKAMDTLMTRLGEQARRLGTLERKA